MEILSTSTTETEKLAKTLAEKVKPEMVLALFGDLGSGKTTFTAFLVKALGFASRVQSPTFVIHRRYKKSLGNPIDTIHHVDLYRLTSKKEVLDIGLPEMLQESHSLVLIEWPELAMDFLPRNVLKLYFTTIDENTRRIIMEESDDSSLWTLPSLRGTE
ncbi:MAG: tRNA (adenosine(37)-N6)-threonylcarbamoyltransferase complex ATPase subunit type 1 TsaE [Patescibacteria group bacterium]